MTPRYFGGVILKWEKIHRFGGEYRCLLEARVSESSEHLKT